MVRSNPAGPGLKPAPRPGRKRTGIKYLPAALPLIAAAAVLIYLAPGFFRAPWGEGTVLVVENEKIGAGKVMLADEEIYIDVETLRLHIDPHLFWDEAEKTAVITTADRVIHMYSDKLTAEVNLRPVELRFPLHGDGERLFLPLLFLADFYGLTVAYHPETDTVAVDRADAPAYMARIVSRSVRLREGLGLNRPYLALLKKGEQVRLEEKPDAGRWVLVRTAAGMTGYLPRKSILLQGPYPSPEKPAREAESPEKRIPPPPLVMTWDVYAYINPKDNTIPMMLSLQIVSPAWFDLLDGVGNMKNLADPVYVNRARQRGYQVWPRVTNSFDREIAAKVLTSSALRRKVIDQLLIYARLYNLDGFNLDFENFHYTYGDHYTQFVRELAPLCAEEGLVLSVAVSMPSEEPYWSKGYDRAALAEAADYIVLMAYDEHWENSPVPGPVASLPWVERGIQQVLEEVPAQKLILGVPFYTRVWQLTSAGGDESLSSKSFSMERIDRILKDREVRFYWDEAAQQKVAEYSDGEEFYRLWLEDGDSMTRRLKLVNRYRLAGVAAWRHGLEKPEIWKLFESVLSSY